MTLTELTNRRPAAGFSLQTDAGALCEGKVLRFLRGRRLVAAAILDDRPVVAKIYAPERRALREYRAELEALRQLQRRDVRAPLLLHCEQRHDGAVLLLAKVPGQSARLLAEGLARDDAALLALALVRFVAQMHKSGCLQEDIHLDNFLVDDQGVTLLDAASVRFADDDFTARQRLDNLALLLAQFFPLHLPSLEQVLKAYDDSAFSRERLSRQLASRRRRRYRHFLRKTTRSCTDFAPLGQGERVKGFCQRRYQDIARQMLERGLDRLVEAGECLKDGNSATVARVSCGGRDWVVKRYNLKDRQQFLKRQFGVTRALNSWRVANWLRHVGIGTPEPLMYVQEYRGLFRGKAWYVSEYSVGEELIAMPPERLRDEGIPAVLAELLWLMKELEFSHGDMKASNFLWRDGTLQVLDLDAVSLLRPPRRLKAKWLRDQQRLLANWPEDHELKDELLRWTKALERAPS